MCAAFKVLVAKQRDYAADLADKMLFTTERNRMLLTNAQVREGLEVWTSEHSFSVVLPLPLSPHLPLSRSLLLPL